MRSLLLAAALLLPAAGARAESVEDVIPLTVGNLRGHKMLYDEGWYVVSSSSRALEYAKSRSIVSSREAIRAALSAAGRGTEDLGRAVRNDAREAGETGARLLSSGTARTAAIAGATGGAARGELAYAEDGFKTAAESFVRGNVSIVRRTEEDRRELLGAPGNYFKNLKSDFSNLDEGVAAARRRFAERIAPAWEESFRQASRDFKAEYDRSGAEKNSLAALGPILRGYLEAFYHGLAAPAAKTLVRTGAEGASLAVFLPAAASTIVAGRTVQSVGLTVFYAGEAGFKVLSPTLEGGLLSAVSLLTLASVPVTYAGGGALGAVNQVAFTAGAPVAAAAQGAAAVGRHSGAYVGLLVSDAASGATKVLINQGESALVLGYNALTALPAQTLLGAGDAAVFLAWDGPRLLVAAATGRLGSGPGGKAYSAGDLPAGTVVDLKALKRVEGVKVETLSADPAVVKRVLERIPADARGADAGR